MFFVTFLLIPKMVSDQRLRYETIKEQSPPSLGDDDDDDDVGRDCDCVFFYLCFFLLHFLAIVVLFLYN